MRITVTDTRTVELTNQQMNEITYQTLKNLLPGDGIENHKGELWLYSWEDTGHGSGITTHIRKATELDLAISNLLEAIHKEMSNETRKM